MIKKSQLVQVWEGESGRGRDVGQMGLPGSERKVGLAQNRVFLCRSEPGDDVDSLLQEGG